MNFFGSPALQPKRVWRSALLFLHIALPPSKSTNQIDLLQNFFWRKWNDFSNYSEKVKNFLQIRRRWWWKTFSRGSESLFSEEVKDFLQFLSEGVKDLLQNFPSPPPKKIRIAIPQICFERVAIGENTRNCICISSKIQIFLKDNGFSN